MEAGETISGLLARSVNDPLVKQVLEVNRIADPRSIREGARIDCLPHLFKLKLNSVVIEGQPLCNHDFIVQVSVSNVGTERWDGGVITLDDTDGGQLGTIPIGSIEPNVPSIFTHTVHAAGSPYQQHTLYARFTGLSGDQREQRTIYMLGCSPMADFTFVGNEGNVEGHITGTITSTSIAVTTYQWTVIVYQDLEGKGPQEGPTYQFSSPSFAIDILVDNDYRHYIEINLVATGYGSVDTCRKVYRGDWSTHDIIFVSEDCTK